MFPRYARVRPGRAVSLVGAAVGVGMLVFAGSMPNVPPPFLLVGAAIIVLNLVNAVAPSGVASEVIDFGPSQAPPSAGAGVGGAPAFCSSCGSALAAGARFCPGCGHQVA